MKKIVLTFLLFVSCIVFVGKVNAQGANLSIAAIDYETREDIDYLFSQSTQVLEYLEGMDIEKPTFLSLVNTDQLENIKNEGYKLRILAENANIDDFVLLYNPQPDQAEVLRPFGEPIVISSHYTLLKLPEGKEFTHEGESGRFFDIPFSTIISPPPLRTKTITTPTPTIVSQEKDVPSVLILGVLAVGAVACVLIFIYIKRKKSQNQAQF